MAMGIMVTQTRFLDLAGLRHHTACFDHIFLLPVAFRQFPRAPWNDDDLMVPLSSELSIIQWQLLRHICFL